MVPARLGVGITFLPEIANVLEGDPGLVDFIEVEPQTLWLPPAGEGPIGVNRQMYERLDALPHPKLVHSVGTPVGGSQPPDRRQLALLRRTIDALCSPWVSDHLSFNLAGGPDGVYFTGFFLPPRQTRRGVETAATAVRQLAAGVGVPVAVETGVSYLAPRADEMSDGAFVAEVAEAADCAILLDVHNIWTNARNRRQAVADYLDELPLERVWELHVAGGHEHLGYWLDAHSGGVPDDVLSIAQDVACALPNLGAVVFEVLPEHLAALGVAGLRHQLSAVRTVWESRPRRASPSVSRRRRVSLPDGSDAIWPALWEDVLGGLVIGATRSGPLAKELAADPGIRLLRSLVDEARAGMVAASLRLSSRLLLLHWGETGLRNRLAEFWRTSPPRLFAAEEGAGFARHLLATGCDVPHAREVLEFELAIISTATSGGQVSIHFRADPNEVLAALAAGQLPPPPGTSKYPLVVSS